jgi:hypothetical protein
MTRTPAIQGPPAAADPHDQGRPYAKGFSP